MNLIALLFAVLLLMGEKAYNHNNIKTSFRCSVWNYDGMGRDDFMGETIVPLADIDFIDEIHAGWYELRPEVSGFPGVVAAGC